MDVPSLTLWPGSTTDLTDRKDYHSNNTRPSEIAQITFKNWTDILNLLCHHILQKKSCLSFDNFCKGNSPDCALVLLAFLLLNGTIIIAIIIIVMEIFCNPFLRWWDWLLSSRSNGRKGTVAGGDSPHLVLITRDDFIIQLISCSHFPILPIIVLLQMYVHYWYYPYTMMMIVTA